MAAAGVLAGAAFGFVLARLAGRYFLDVKMPGALPVFVSAFVLMTVALIASVLRASMFCKRCAPSDRRTGVRVTGNSKREMNLRAAGPHGSVRSSLKVVGTLAALDLAAAHGLVDLQTMFERLRATTFRW
jgi:hypothetical protein